MIENSGKQTEILHRQILMRPGVEEHPIGHTDKVYRYRTHLGQEFAVEKRRRNPILLVPAAAVQVVPPLPVTTVAAGRNGRNSNLNALATLRGYPLLRLEVRSMADANLLLQSLG